MRCSRRNFVELCYGLTAEDEQAFEELWRHLGLSVDWSLTYTTIDDQSRRVEPAGVPAQPGPGRGLPGRGPDAVGRPLPDGGGPGRAGGPRAARAPTTASRSRRDGGEPVVIDTTRPELIPACVALVAHPDDERYQPLFETEVRTPLFGVEVPVQGPPPGRPREGLRHRHDLHLRRHHRRDLVAGAGPARAGRRRSERPAARRRPATSSPTRPPTSTAELAGKTLFSAKERIVELLGEAGALAASPARSPTR